MIKKWAFSIVTVAVFISVVGIFVSNTNKNPENKLAFIGGIGNVAIKPLVLSQEDVSNITKSAIVSVYHHINGKAVIPYFDIDWNKLEIIFPGTKKSLDLPVDQYIRGSGFIVSQDGYIITNAHVVSDVYYKRYIAQQLVALRFAAAVRSAKELAQIDATLKNKGIDVVDATQFGEELAITLGGKLAEKIALAASSTISVLNPSSAENKLSAFIDKGFLAKIVDVNDDSFKDQKDVSILKIDEANLPTMDLDASQTISIGNKVYIYGFPSAGQFNTKDVLEPTFTEGTISGFKDSKTKEFRVIQTDAKVSVGSSGGPLLNDKGDAVGVLTFATEANTVGDAFAFAIPISLAQDMLERKHITIKESDFARSFKNGILYTQNSRCKKAMENFDVAKNINKNFSVTKNIQPYLDTCAALISSGKSIDNAFDEFRAWTNSLGFLSWFLAGVGALVLIIIIFIIRKLVKRIRKDELEIGNLEHNFIVNNQPSSNQQNTPNTPPPIDIAKNIDPRLLNYIKSARNSGLSDTIIINELKKAGWTEDAIRLAITK